MLKRGQAEPVPLPGREGAGQESCPKQPQGASGGSLIHQSHLIPAGCLSWGQSLSQQWRSPGLQSAFPSIHCVWKNLLGHSNILQATTAG